MTDFEFKKVRLGEYELGAGIGSWAMSREYGIKKGDVRFIGGVLMYAYSIYRRGVFKPLEVNWTPVDDKYNTNENLREWLRR